MTWIPNYVWLIPLLPLVAAGLSALCKRPQRTLSAALAIGSMAGSLALSLIAFAATLQHTGEGVFREESNFAWFQFGDSPGDLVRLGFVLDPLAAVMLVMVSFVGLLIFIYSVGYMARDENFTRFFTFLSLFAAAMLGVVIANSLLLLFICWELVGLASYLLIGFWFHKPSAAAAAKKAFITTRIGDIGFFLGLVWLYKETGTLLFYDNGLGCMEQSALAKLVGASLAGGMAVSTVIALLIFCGAAGKSGQLPLHVWLPDAMEGPTPVSALIHAATMVAAGVFLVARVFPLMSTGLAPVGGTTALQVVTWVGALTAVFASLIAVAQTDIKRILAYSTVSQLGFMMMGLGVGGVAAGMFHLITHAFFKALLFLGAGSVIHGCHEEQDIRRMGGVKKYMPVTFATYAVGMMALAGVFPLAGFWSKDEILHSAHGWVSSGPFYLGLFGALLTAFYMTRQVTYVFFGKHHAHPHGEPHESPTVMTVPLVILAVFAALLGFVGTPWWPAFQQYLGAGHDGSPASGAVPLMVVSTLVALAGITAGWMIYGRKPAASADDPDPLETKQPALFALLRDKFRVDELYEATVIRWNALASAASDVFDRFVWGGVVMFVSLLTLGVSWIGRFFDEYVINFGFDEGCRGVRAGSDAASRTQDGKVQNYLRVLGLALAALVLLVTWGLGK
ncbi:MAG: NADH-quinone oxidoreductase subunit L [Verrucomicrobia bacterium]|nr:NADH-quinone oxidoreductase subunit L [Verrucomicrobiota bacterium]